MEIIFDNKFSIQLRERGVNIDVSSDFHHDVLTRRYPDDAPPYMSEISDCGCENCLARLVFSQLRRSLESGVTSEAYYESKVVELLYLLSGDYACKDKLPYDDLRVVSVVKEIICSRICDCPKIAELAAMTHTSISKLQNDFKTAFGQTIHECLWEARMVRALDLLEQSDAPIYIIAAEVGCRKPGRFSEMFKKTYGVLPNEFRRARVG